LDGPVHETDVPLLRRERASFSHVKQWFSVTLSRKNLMGANRAVSLLFPRDTSFWQPAPSLAGKSGALLVLLSGGIEPARTQRKMHPTSFRDKQR
jgi:hypothetical protein